MCFVGREIGALSARLEALKLSGPRLVTRALTTIYEGDEVAVSKRTRFEVLRRDENRCRYCRSAENPLTIDHVLPVALGGSDDPSNLVAACRDCNAGKSSTTPDGPLVADVSEDAIRWAKARMRAVDQMRAAREDRALDRQPFLDAWKSWDSDLTHLPSDWRESVDRWLDAGITCAQLVEAVGITIPKRHIRHAEVFRYVSGIIRNWLFDLDNLTQQIMAEDGE